MKRYSIKLLFIAILIISTITCKKQSPLDNLFNFDTLNEDIDRIKALQLVGEISKTDILGIRYIAINYEENFDYAIENKTYAEIIADINVFREQGGIVKTSYNVDNKLDYEIAPIGLESLEYLVQIIIKNDTENAKIKKLILLTEDITGTEQITFLYENEFFVQKGDSLRVGLSFESQYLEDQIKKLSKIRKIQFTKSEIFNNIRFKIFAAEELTSESIKTSKVEFYISPDCSFTKIIEENKGIKNTEMKVKEIFPDVLNLTCY